MNVVRLSARIVELSAPRYTPAGLPALDIRLEHESVQQEADQLRQVKVVLKAVAIGATAERLGKQTVGSCWCFTGFLSSPRHLKSVLLHIQDFQQNQFQGAL
ncbi:primosomal replication protein N [Ottowia sp.]|uniref:primosomal replication protein N n=1 Tax=Ottowia sp. TaxID=1898956 RepID=UPI003A8BE82F